MLLSTHAPEILDDEGVSPVEVLVLQVGTDGSTAEILATIPRAMKDLELGLATSDVVAALIAPDDLTELARGATLHDPWVVLRDADRWCPVALAGRLLPPSPGDGFLLRIAVAEMESWLLADVDGVAKELSVSTGDLPQDLDELPDPKRTLVQSRGSRSRG